MRKRLEYMTKRQKNKLLNSSDAKILSSVIGCPKGTENKKCSSSSNCAECIREYLR